MKTSGSGTKRTREPPRRSSVTSTEAQNSLGEILGRVAAGERVFVTRYGRPPAVLLSVEAYERLADEEVVDLRALEEEFDALVDRMQRSGHRSATDALFEMTGRELGEAARRAAERTRVHDDAAADEDGEDGR